MLAPVAMAAIGLGGWWFAILVAVLAVGLGVEWAALLRFPPRSLRGAVLIGWPTAAAAAALWTGRWYDVAVVVLPASFALGPAVLAGVLAVGWGSLALLWLRLGSGGVLAAAPSGWMPVLFVVLVVWSSDSAAYAVGRALGGAKLAPRISPGKTWSGAAGGLAGAGAAGLFCALLLPGQHAGTAETVLRGGGFGMLLGLAAQAGDLAESALKRRCGVKDSGRLIPGHGGLLDRLDGLLAAAPVAALLSLVAPPGAGFWYAGANGPSPDPGAWHAGPWRTGAAGG